MIGKSAIKTAFTMEDYVKTVEKAFKLYGNEKVQMPPKQYLSFPDGDLRCMPCYILRPKHIAGVKNVNVHPGNRDKGLPTVMATITLFDPDTGYPLAIMDGTHITNMRTGAAGAVAAKYLARDYCEVAAFVGAGAQAMTQLEGLMITKPEISKIVVSDKSKDNIDKFVEFTKNNYDWIDIEIADSIRNAVKNADIVTTTTPVRSPIVKAEYIRKGTHINAIGADGPGKQELSVDLIKNATVIIDEWEQASHSGEINVAVSDYGFTKADIYGNIGEIVTGKKVGRTSNDEITVFDSTGLGLQDIASADEILQKLKNTGLMKFNFQD